MLVNQKLVLDHDKNRTVHLYNTYDFTEEAREAMRLAAETGETVRLSSGMELKPMGFIPPNMWDCDPWLGEAAKARNAGDEHEYKKYMEKFFEIYPYFKSMKNKKFF